MGFVCLFSCLHGCIFSPCLTLIPGNSQSLSSSLTSVCIGLSSIFFSHALLAFLLVITCWALAFVIFITAEVRPDCRSHSHNHGYQSISQSFLFPTFYDSRKKKKKNKLNFDTDYETVNKTSKVFHLIYLIFYSKLWEHSRRYENIQLPLTLCLQIPTIVPTGRVHMPPPPALFFLPLTIMLNGFPDQMTLDELWVCSSPSLQPAATDLFSSLLLPCMGCHVTISENANGKTLCMTFVSRNESWYVNRAVQGDSQVAAFSAIISSSDSWEVAIHFHGSLHPPPRYNHKCRPHLHRVTSDSLPRCQVLLTSSLHSGTDGQESVCFLGISQIET